MITKVVYDNKPTSVFISEEKGRKDFVLWAGFKLLGVYKSVDQCKFMVTNQFKDQGFDVNLLEYR